MKNKNKINITHLIVTWIRIPCHLNEFTIFFSLLNVVDTI